MPNFKNTPHAQALILLFIAMISMQSSGSLAKILFGQFPVLTVSVMRLLLGSLILAMIFKIWHINFKHVNWRAISSYGIALAGSKLVNVPKIKGLKRRSAIISKENGNALASMAKAIK